MNATGTVGSGYLPESRNTAFQGGVAGTGLAHPIGSAATIQSAPIQSFRPQGVLELPNMLSTPNGMAGKTFEQTKPFDSSMRALTQSLGGNSGVMPQ